jgi:ATPase family associated with various cellular activities (AAA)
MLELLNQLDGFDTRGDVKVIMATNKIETLDPALIRPGRIDRKIEFPLPDVKTKRHIFRLVATYYCHWSSKSTLVQVTYVAHELGRGRGSGGVRHGERRLVWGRHQGDLYRGRFDGITGATDEGK